MKRYTNRTFPPYRYIPGKAPHPVRDPEGHSWNQQPVKLENFTPGLWQQCEMYLYGIDLFNHGYWWEAHEALEAVWVAAGRNTKTGLFIQGLIQIAVAHLKRFQGFEDVAQRMGRDGLDKMKTINGIFLGIDVVSFRQEVLSCFSNTEQLPVSIDLIFSDKD